MKEWNKIFTIVLIGVALTTSTGCSAKENKLAQDVINTVKNKARNFAKDKWQDIEDRATEESDYVDPETEDLLEQASIVMNSFESKDEEALFMLFNEYAQENYKENLEQDIKGAFDFVNGKIISCDDPSVFPGAKTTDENGPVERYRNVEVNHILIDKGKSYTIKFEVCDVNKEHEELVGIDGIGIFDEDVPPGGEYTDETAYVIGGYDYDEGGM